MLAKLQGLVSALFLKRIYSMIGSVLPQVRNGQLSLLILACQNCPLDFIRSKSIISIRNSVIYNIIKCYKQSIFIIRPKNVSIFILCIQNICNFKRHLKLQFRLINNVDYLLNTSFDFVYFHPCFLVFPYQNMSLVGFINNRTGKQNVPFLKAGLF